ncbi:proline-specific peptidase [Mycena sp. CBHHK59/15]|nr:proline-specific peptidase [Mycena sp. CBHHK59/15]
MPPVTSTEGELDFPLPAAGKPCRTWYKIFGDLGSRRPLVALHGGPGVNHSYLTALEDLTAIHGIPLVLYDQLGNGLSTHLPEKMGDVGFWTEDLFLAELDNVLEKLGIKDDYDLLGHSWGGMLGSRHASAQPPGLKRLIIVSSPAEMGLWVTAQNKLRTNLPQDVQDTLTAHEAAGTTSSKEYQDAVNVFYAKYLCVLHPPPEPVTQAMEWIEKDPTVYLTMNGPSEFHITGPLKDWSMLDDAHNIIVPTLLINGRMDEAQNSVVEPFFRAITKVKWVELAESSHMAMWEERERFMEVLGGFLVE